MQGPSDTLPNTSCSHDGHRAVYAGAVRYVAQHELQFMTATVQSMQGPSDTLLNTCCSHDGHRAVNAVAVLYAAQHVLQSWREHVHHIQQN